MATSKPKRLRVKYWEYSKDWGGETYTRQLLVPDPEQKVFLHLTVRRYRGSRHWYIAGMYRNNKYRLSSPFGYCMTAERAMKRILDAFQFERLQFLNEEESARYTNLM